MSTPTPTDTQPSDNGHADAIDYDGMLVSEPPTVSTPSTSKGRSPRIVPRRPANPGPVVEAYATALGQIQTELSPRQRRWFMTALSDLTGYHSAQEGLRLALHLCGELADIAAARAVLAALLEADKAGEDVPADLRAVVHTTMLASLRGAPESPQDGRSRKRVAK
jgi:hypothetical protein